MASDEENPQRPDEKGHEQGHQQSQQKGSGAPFEQFEQAAPGGQLVQRVRALTEALEGSDISELELTEDGARILIRRQLEAPVVQAPGGFRRGAARNAAPGSFRRSAAGESAAPAASPMPGIAVVAPLTGVYYGSSSPSSPPFVSVGDTVQAGQVVCLVEAMKVFNEIKAEISGTVIALVATGGQLVHRGEPLIRIQPI